MPCTLSYGHFPIQYYYPRAIKNKGLICANKKPSLAVFSSESLRCRKGIKEFFESQ